MGVAVLACTLPECENPDDPGGADHERDHF